MRNKWHLHSDLSSGLPADISSYADTSGLSALEFVEPISSDSYKGAFTRCMQSAIGFLREDIPQIHLILLVHRLPWNAGGALSKRKGVWHNVPQGLIEGSFPNGVSNLDVPYTKELWGYAECFIDKVESLIDTIRSLDGVFIITVEPFDQSSLVDVLNRRSNQDYSSSLHVAMEYCELKPTFLLWPYPSFDDREMAIFVIGQRFRIAKPLLKLQSKNPTL